jgi:beta-lactamase superfamily II metal-dependent hydrolase
MFTLQMLPAERGDCLWLEYGSPPRYVVVDGGLKQTASALLDRMEEARRLRATAELEIELLVVTHIDNDHIQGAIELLRRLPSWARIKDVWFNGRPQLVALATGPGPSVEDAEAHLLGPKEGDELSEMLEASACAWNKRAPWNGGAILLPPSGRLPAITLDGGLVLTVLGPSRERLRRLWAVWSKARSGDDETEETAALATDLLGRQDRWPPVWQDGESRDSSAANGSSIALLAEYAGQAVLLAGDAYAADLEEGISRLGAERGVVPGEFALSAFKLSHHGSHRNLTRSLLEQVRCSRYLISTDGSGHSHPDHQALLRVLRHSRSAPQLHFNYLADTTRRWRDSREDVLQRGFQDYETHYPVQAESGLTLTLA